MDRKVTVTTRAFLARMKRHLLKAEGETLKQAREGTRAYQDFGPFYTIDENNCLQRQGLSLQTLIEWAREDGVLKPYEVIEDTAA